jgi:hypothetical protein
VRQPIAPWRLGKCQALTTGAVAVATAALTNYGVMLVATQDCHVKIGNGVIAVAGDSLIRAGFPPLVFACAPGEVVSVIEDTTPGTLYVTELSY